MLSLFSSCYKLFRKNFSVSYQKFIIEIRPVKHPHTCIGAFMNLDFFCFSTTKVKTAPGCNSCCSFNFIRSSWKCIKNKLKCFWFSNSADILVRVKSQSSKEMLKTYAHWQTREKTVVNIEKYSGSSLLDLNFKRNEWKFSYLVCSFFFSRSFPETTKS